MPLQLIFSLNFIVQLTFTWIFLNIVCFTFNSNLARINFIESILLKSIFINAEPNTRVCLDPLLEETKLILVVYNWFWNVWMFWSWIDFVSRIDFDMFKCFGVDWFCIHCYVSLFKHKSLYSQLTYSQNQYIKNKFLHRRSKHTLRLVFASWLNLWCWCEILRQKV